MRQDRSGLLAARQRLVLSAVDLRHEAQHVVDVRRDVKVGPSEVLDVQHGSRRSIGRVVVVADEQSPADG